MQNTNSLLLRGFRDFLESSYANALDDKHFSSNAGDAICGRGETKYREERGTRIYEYVSPTYRAGDATGFGSEVKICDRLFLICLKLY